MPHFSRKFLRSVLLHLHLRNPTPTPPPATPLTALPNELLLLIAELLPPASLNSLLRCSHHLLHLLTPLLHKYVLRDWHTTTPFPETLHATPALLYAASRNYYSLARIVCENQHIPATLSHFRARCPRGLTALHWATLNRNEEMVHLLLTAGANVNATDDNFGETPLHIAARLGYIDIMKLLLRRGAEIDKKLIARATPLAGAVKRVQTRAVKVLLEWGAVRSFVDRRGDTLLHWAAEFGSVEMVKVLLEYPGFKIDARNDSEKTPLHWAVVRTRDAAEVTRLLLESGADVDALDSPKRSPLYYALDELLKEYRYKKSKAPDRRKREAVVKLLFEQDPYMAPKTITLLEECRQAVGKFSRFRAFLVSKADPYFGWE